MDIVHTSVMLEEVLGNLKPKSENSLVIDCTMGEGGHSLEFLSRYPNIELVGLDRDSEIQAVAKKRLENFSNRVSYYNVWFDDFFKNYPTNLDRPDVILFDLGISVYHYEKAGRGFSFRDDEQLDMRLDASGDLTAFDIVNNYREQELANLIYSLGEERYSRRISKAICEYRKEKNIETAFELSEIIRKCVPLDYRRGKIHPATKTFQALRIAVNSELDRVDRALRDAFRVLNVRGVIGVISFHSLEDRVVKLFFKELRDKYRASGNKYDKSQRNLPVLEFVNKKPIVASFDEIKLNPPSRSAKLRVVRKLRDE